MIDLSTLNPQQREAVTHGEGPLLVLAGAGSGKTRVITHRIAYLIGAMEVAPRNILAVTFTNKAANEMLERVSRLVPSAGGRPIIGTFHSTSLRVLRRYADRIGYTSSFVVYDTSDQLTLIRRCMRELQLDEDAFQPRSVLGRISKAKNDLIGPVEFEKTNFDFFGTRVADVYRLYQKRLREFDAMDFDDLIGQYARMLREHDDIRAEVQERFQHILIDEYQDTNHAQYTLVKLLAGDRGNVMAVGDEDQSIYRFRGANIQNILRFERDFPGAKVIKLEQNYRSTGNILDAAIGVVANNIERKGKTLFTDSGRGEPVHVVACATDRDEAQFVVQKIQELRREIPLKEFAVLFRTNAQSRAFEEELLRANIAYSVVGGVKFYERAEIKDILSYLRLALRPQDSPAIERVINTPTRGIGATTVKALEEAARSNDIPLWQVITGDMPFLSDRARKAVREFRDIIVDLQQAATRPTPEIMDFALVRTGYRKSLLESRDPQDETRLENLNELVNSAREFHEANPESSLSDYLDSVSLISDLDTLDGSKGITLMTLHAAKGLEFKVVFLAGLEEGLLPHSNSRDSEDDVEEERRLCYVGMTRARERLYCLHSRQRRIYGQFREQNVSPFVDEIPPKVRQDLRIGSTMSSSMSGVDRRGGSGGYGWREAPVSRDRGGYPPSHPSSPAPAARRAGSDTANVAGFFSGGPVQFDPSSLRSAPAPAAATPAAAGGELDVAQLKRGMKVRHEQFGVGHILTIEGSGPAAKLSVYFDRAGTKKFVAKFAKLTRV